jgi:hypothetical protein
MSENNDAMDTISKLMAKKEREARREAVTAEEVEEYKRCLEIVFNSPAGLYFAVKLLKYCGIYTYDQNLNPAKMVEDAGKRRVYLELIRPYLSKETLMKVENQ